MAALYGLICLQIWKPKACFSQYKLIVMLNRAIYMFRNCAEVFPMFLLQNKSLLVSEDVFFANDGVGT